MFIKLLQLKLFPALAMWTSNGSLWTVILVINNFFQLHLDITSIEGELTLVPD